MFIGYARVSTTDQNLDLHVKHVKCVKWGHISISKYSPFDPLHPPS